jgi:molybdopterin-guanine dinucleotide biosynthesis protein A
VPDAAGQLDLILLELHPGAAAIAEPAPCQIGADLAGGDLHAGRQPLENRDEGRAVGLTSSYPAQHLAILSDRVAAGLSARAAIMVSVERDTGWEVDPRTLRPAVTDHRLLERALEQALPIDRLLPLGLLGRSEQALVEGGRLLDDPAVRADPWQLLLTLADLHCLRADFPAAELCHRQAWRHALGRERQAGTLHSIGLRQLEQGDGDAAAASFELALTLLSLFGETEQRTRTATALALVRSGAGLGGAGLGGAGLGGAGSGGAGSGGAGSGGAGPGGAFDALILAGGRGSRMGGPAKPLRKLAGWPMLDHVLLACSAASRQIVVGPSRIGIGSPLFCREQPAGSGPVAAISTGLGHVQQPIVVILAADLPFIAGALRALRDLVAGGSEAAALVEPSGRINYLAAAWRTASLYAALDRLGDPAGRPVRAVFDSVAVSYLPDFDAHGADCDTPMDLRAAEERIRRHSPGRLPAAQLAWPRLELHSPS